MCVCVCYVCMYVCIYIYIYIYIRHYMYVCMFSDAPRRLYHALSKLKWVCMYDMLSVWVCVYALYIITCIHMYVCVLMQLHIISTCIHMYVCFLMRVWVKAVMKMHLCNYTSASFTLQALTRICTWMHACIYIYIYIYIYCVCACM
jgi:hypothetical protein